MKQLKNKLWWEAAGTRAIKTFAQTLVSMVGVSAIGIGDVNWITVLSAAALSAILSVATSIAGLPEVKAAEEMEAIVDGTN